MVGLSIKLSGSSIEVSQWRDLCISFGISFDNVWLRGNEVDGNQWFFNIINKVDEIPEGPEIVIVQPMDAREVRGEQNLITFVHPKEAIYVFGANSKYMSCKEFGDRVPEHKVFIPVGRELYSWNAGAIVLYDRISKVGI